MKLIYCLTIFLWPFVSTGQKIKPLTIGDKVPDITIRNIINYKTTSANLSDFKDKLVILDFMSSGCISCIEALPELDSLQTQYHDKLIILVVSSEPLKRMKAFLKKNPVASKVNLSVVSDDSILSQVFPHVFISHEVWIKGGIVKAITGSQYVNNGNVKTVLDNIPVNWPVKRDIAEFDYTAPIFNLNQEAIPLLSYPTATSYSVFTNSMKDIPHRFTRVTDKATRSIRISLINLPVVGLYRYCYGQISLAPGNIILNVKDTNHYVYNADKDYRAKWTIKNTYCYETRLSSSLSQVQVRDKMAADLDFYLGISSSWEIKPVRCLVLAKKQVKGKKGLTDKVPDMASPLKLNPQRPVTASYIVYELNQNLWGIPVLDESGWDNKKILNTTVFNFSNLAELNNWLEKYGLEITTAVKPQKMLVLTEKKQAF